MLLCSDRARKTPGFRGVGILLAEIIPSVELKELLIRGVINGETVALDTTFVKAYSRRDPHANSRGKSDSEARVGRTAQQKSAVSNDYEQQRARLNSSHRELGRNFLMREQLLKIGFLI